MLVALLSCPKDNSGKRCTALEMYSTNRIFKAAYSYAVLAADRVFLLSSRYGLLEMDDEINPTVENMALKAPYEKRLWTANVIDKLSKLSKPSEDEYMIIAEKGYYEYVAGELRKKFFPLEGVPEDDKINTLKMMEADEREYVSAEKAHRFLNEATEYTWDRIDEIPFSNGVYFMFEKDETFREYRRISMVGTHQGDGNLKTRLQTHFIREDKNWSILRKNIGRAMLNREKDPYLKIWDMDTGTPESRIRYSDQIDEVKESDLEKKVSIFLRYHMTFACIEVDSWYDRIRIEEGLVATLNMNPDYRPSAKWLGCCSPEYEIRNSGLWMKRGLDKIPLKRRWMEMIEKSVRLQTETLPDRKKGDIHDRILKIVCEKKQRAEQLRIRYIDLFSEDIISESENECSENEVVEAMKEVMGQNDRVISEGDNESCSPVLIRYFL